jgi:hypothetical protein
MPTTTQDLPVKTAEELELEKLNAAPQADKDALADFTRDILGQEKPKPEDPVKPAPPKPRATKVKTPAKPAPAPVAAPEVDHEALAEAVSRGVATAMAPKEPPKTPVKDEFEDLPEKEQRKIPVLKELEAMFPDRYKGLANNYAQNLKAVVKYQEEWEKENPDKEFDPEAEEHNGFYAKHVVDWDEDDFAEALAEIKVKKARTELKAESDQRLTAIEKREQAREFEPQAHLEAKRVARDVFNALGDDQFKDVVDARGMVNQALAAKVIAEDPMAADIIFPEVVKIERLCAESFRLHNGVTDFDKSNPDHQFLANFATTQESEIQALPKSKQFNEDGKRFATAADFNRMTPEQQSRHYRLSAQDLNNLLAADLGARAKARLVGERTRLEAMAKKYGYTKGGLPNEPVHTPEPEPDNDKPVAVTTKGVPVGSTASTARDHKPQNADAALAREWMG